MSKKIDIGKKVKEILSRADKEISLLADDYRAKVLLPFCLKNDLRYVTGNRDIYFVTRGDEHITNEDDARRHGLGGFTRVWKDLNTFLGDGVNIFGFQVADIVREVT